MTRVDLCGAEADIERMTSEEAHCLMYINGCSDTELKKRLKEKVKPSKAELRDLAASWERANENSCPAKAAATSQKQNKNKNKKKSDQSNEKRSERQKTPHEIAKREQMRGKCFKCASTGHSMGSCTLSPEHVCENCGKNGHNGAACFQPPKGAKTQQVQQQQQQPEAPQQQQQYEQNFPALEYQAAHANALRDASQPTPRYFM